jgi:hypothetical protein
MNKELKELLESKKSDGKKKKGCTSCKKKQPITELPQVIEDEDYIPFIPSTEDIKLAYIELGNKDQNKKEFINKVYSFLFNEDFNFGCTSCMNVQVRKLKNYINDELKLNVL